MMADFHTSRIKGVIIIVSSSDCLSTLHCYSAVLTSAYSFLQFLINMMMSKKALFRTHYDYFQAHPGKKAIVKKVFAAMGFLLLAFLIIRK